MKTAFNILPSEAHTGYLNLIIELGWYGVSFAWFKKDPLALEGILSYNFNERITAKELAANLNFIFEKESIFALGPDSVTVCYNFKESILVPSIYHKQVYNKDHLDVIYGIAPGSLLKADLINHDSGIANTELIHNVYRVEEEVHTALLHKFPMANFKHSTSLQLQNDDDADVHCIVFHNTIKLIFFKKNQLQLVQQFQYKTPEDVVYHLLNACDKYEMPIQELVLMLRGMIDAQSNLYQELYKYFLNISFEPISDEVFLSNEIKAFPTHFFSHLTALAKCVS